VEFVHRAQRQVFRAIASRVVRLLRAEVKARVLYGRAPFVALDLGSGDVYGVTAMSYPIGSSVPVPSGMA
jgi:hypothetical protein